MSKMREMVDKMLAESDPQTVSKEIIRQMGGNRALMLLGAKQLSYGTTPEYEPYLQFRIGKNSAGINNIRITLTHRDTYDLEFGKIRGMVFAAVKEVEGVYADMLVDTIEDVTGMYLSL